MGRRPARRRLLGERAEVAAGVRPEFDLIAQQGEILVFVEVRTRRAGLEAALARNWTAKVEYLYVDLGSFNCGLNCGAGFVTDNVSFHTNLLRAG